MRGSFRAALLVCIGALLLFQFANNVLRLHVDRFVVVNNLSLDDNVDDETASLMSNDSTILTTTNDNTTTGPWDDTERNASWLPDNDDDREEESSRRRGAANNNDNASQGNSSDSPAGATNSTTTMNDTATDSAERIPQTTTQPTVTSDPTSSRNNNSAFIPQTSDTVHSNNDSNSTDSSVCGVQHSSLPWTVTPRQRAVRPHQGLGSAGLARLYRNVSEFVDHAQVIRETPTELQCWFLVDQLTQHFPHAMEQVYRCWSVVQEHRLSGPKKQAVLVYPFPHKWFPLRQQQQQQHNGSSLPPKWTSPFLQGVFEALPSLNISLRALKPHAFYQQLGHNQTFRQRHADGYGILPRHAHALTQALLRHYDNDTDKEENKEDADDNDKNDRLKDNLQNNNTDSTTLETKNSTTISTCPCHVAPRVAILNRRHTRHLSNAHALARALERNLTVLTNAIKVVDFDGGPSLAEQLRFFARTDILISPHGAQLTGVAFMSNGRSVGAKKCSPTPQRAVLELFPPKYCIPYYFASLAVNAGLHHSYLALSNQNKTTDPMTACSVPSTPSARARARRGSVCPPVAVVVNAVQTLVQQWKASCCCSTLDSTENEDEEDNEEGGDDNDETEASETETPTHDHVVSPLDNLAEWECQDLVDFLSQQQPEQQSEQQHTQPWTRFQINQLRRHVFLYRSECIPETLPYFAARFQSTPFFQRHLLLHIPKAGGTSICQFLQQQQAVWDMNLSISKVTRASAPRTTNLTVNVNTNCWTNKLYGPTWCCAGDKYRSRSRTCPEQAQLLFQQRIAFVPPGRLGLVRVTKEPMAPYHANFQMNENWLDGPLCESQTQSILVREPVSRALSNYHHHLQFAKRKWHASAGKAKIKTTTDSAESSSSSSDWRVDLIRNNYMTWSLSAHKFTPPKKGNHRMPHLFRPSLPEHLQEAKTRLEHLDILLDLSVLARTPMTNTTSSCLDVVLTYMGIYDANQPHARIPHTNKAINHASFLSSSSNASATNSSLSSGSSSTSPHSTYNVTAFQEQNRLDVQLYDHAKQLLRADCDFLDRILGLAAGV